MDLGLLGGAQGALRHPSVVRVFSEIVQPSATALAEGYNKAFWRRPMGSKAVRGDFVGPALALHDMLREP